MALVLVCRKKISKGGNNWCSLCVASSPFICVLSSGPRGKVVWGERGGGSVVWIAFCCKARQLRFYRTFQTQRQFKVLHQGKENQWGFSLSNRTHTCFWGESSDSNVEVTPEVESNRGKSTSDIFLIVWLIWLNSSVLGSQIFMKFKFYFSIIMIF